MEDLFFQVAVKYQKYWLEYVKSGLADKQRAIKNLVSYKNTYLDNWCKQLKESKTISPADYEQIKTKNSIFHNKVKEIANNRTAQNNTDIKELELISNQIIKEIQQLKHKRLTILN